MPGRDTQLNTAAISRIIVLLSAIMLVAAGWFWWHNVYLSPNNVFWGMVDNNLSSAGVTRHVSQVSSDKSVDQYIREQFGPVNASENFITLKQTDATGQSVVKTDTIGTPDNDYSKYVSIITPPKTATGQKIDTSKVLGVWGKSADAPKGGRSSAQYFQQSILTILPFGNFNDQQKQSLVNFMQDHKVYDAAISSAKSERQNGRAVFVYEVNIAPSAYIQLMQIYVKDLGQGDLGLDPSVYANSPDLKAQITVDKLSRQLVKINYPDSGQSETVVDQNLDQPISLPTDTIPVAELQSRLQKVVQ